MSNTENHLSSRVSIPEQFFLQEAIKEYWDVQGRLIGELVQNSIDAKAKNIHLSFTDTSFTCKDDGSGMTKDVLIPAMLSLGGTKKSGNATGGFGAAKKLILFAHKRYEIQTQNITVNGSVLDYDLTEHDTEFVTGTTIHSEYFSNSPFNKYGMTLAANEFLSKCMLGNRCDIFVNNKLFTDYQTISNTTNNEVGTFGFTNKIGSEIHVLHNGLYMFNRYLGKNVCTKVTVLNVTRFASVDVFSQSRDSLRGCAATLFDQLVVDLASNPLSFGKKKPVKTVFRGKSRFYEVLFGTAAIPLIFSTDEITALKEMLVAFSDKQLSPLEVAELAAVQLQPNFPNIVDKINTVDFSGNVDFHFHSSEISDSELKRYHPTTGNKKYKMLSNLYKAIITEIARITSTNLQFCVGFVVEPETLGKYSRDNNVFFIDPRIADAQTAKQRFYLVLMIAIHEFVHFEGHSSHDERFSSRLTTLSAQVLPEMFGFVKGNQLAKNG